MIFNPKGRTVCLIGRGTVRRDANKTENVIERTIQ